eukprot:scaffold4795_cov185-Alexandrium_tamarense.AAC.8
MKFTSRISIAISTIAMLLIKLSLLLVGTSDTAHTSNAFSYSGGRQKTPINANHSSRLFNPLLRPHPMLTSTLLGSLRDILGDGSGNKNKSASNSHINTVEERQKLTKKLQNTSTQEIKRELEQKYKINTGALRGKDQLITALVMARLTGSLSVPPSDIGGVDPNFRDQFVQFEEIEERARGMGNSRPGGSGIFTPSSKDIGSMGIGEIKRELQMYGVNTDSFIEKRELLDVLVRERQLRNMMPPTRPKTQESISGSPRTMPEMVTPMSEFDTVMHSDEEGNEAMRSPSRMTELTQNQSVGDQSSIPFSNIPTPGMNQQQQQQLFFVNDTTGGYEEQNMETTEKQGRYNPNMGPSEQQVLQQEQTNDRDKLRQLQIAFEFERVQSSLPSPDAIQAELSARFNIDAKYFLGINEMAYALAVARVDDAIDKQRRRHNGEDVDGCVVGEDSAAPISKNKNVNIDNKDMNTCEEEDGYYPATREQLIAMEFERLQPLDEYELSWELEAQYGIPAKHFLGKKEMAYALAVERVDQAEKEAKESKPAVDNSADEIPYFDHDTTAMQNEMEARWSDQGSSVMTDEDMMRMMEEEMMKEESQSIDPRKSVGGTTSVRSTPQPQRRSQPKKPPSLKDILQSNSPKGTSRPSSQSANQTFQAQQLERDQTLKQQGENNALREKRLHQQQEYERAQSAREREIRSRQRQTSYQPQTGTVIDGRSDGNPLRTPKDRPTSVNQQRGPPSKNQAQSPSLSDVLKGSSTKKAAPRGRATIAPPRPKQQQQPRSQRSASKASSAFDGNYGVGAWKSSTFARGSSATANPNGFGMPPPPGSSRQQVYTESQRPFETAPFGGPRSYNNQGVPPRPPHDYGYTETQSSSTSFEPGTFTAPQKHKVDFSMPPPNKKRRVNTNPRSFNVRDTPDPSARPFVGSQTYNQNVPPSPPLRVEPPPKDENNPIPERPFEPAPFSRPQPHTVSYDMPPRAPPGGTWNKTPPNPNQRRRQGPNNSSKSDGPSPFDSLRDLFKNMRAPEKKSETTDSAAKAKDNVKYKGEAIEVISDDDDDEEWSPLSASKTAAQNIQVIDAEVENGQQWTAEEEKETYETYSEAWRGGPKSKPAEVPEFATSFQSGDNRNVNGDSGEQESVPFAIQRAQELLANPQIRAIVARAQSNPKVREAVADCMGDARKFGQFLEDPEVGPILRELKECI